MNTRKIALPNGESIPVLGQGTWHMAENSKRRAEEIAALRTGIELGMTLIDTAEMYANGSAEELVAEAIDGRRGQVFLVDKVLPGNASRSGTVTACERSLRRLRTDRIDLYLLHWRGGVPLIETVEAFEKLMEAGKIRYWGVSNLDVEDLEELITLKNGADLATDQVVYNLTRRGVEWDLLPWCEERKIAVMAYSPIEEGRLAKNEGLKRVAERHHATSAQIALAWVLRREGVIAIPKSGNSDHVRDNHAALNLRLTEQDLKDLDQLFPPPSKKLPLEMI